MSKNVGIQWCPESKLLIRDILNKASNWLWKGHISHPSCRWKDYDHLDLFWAGLGAWGGEFWGEGSFSFIFLVWILNENWRLQPVTDKKQKHRFLLGIVGNSDLKKKEIASVKKASPAIIKIDLIGWDHLSSSWAAPSIEEYLYSGLRQITDLQLFEQKMTTDCIVRLP